MAARGRVGSIVIGSMGVRAACTSQSRRTAASSPGDARRTGGDRAGHLRRGPRALRAVARPLGERAAASCCMSSIVPPFP